MLDVNHDLYKLSESIDWIKLEKDVFSILDDQHAPHWRLVCGSVYLKSFFELSSAELLEKWLECPYCRFFCSGDIIIENPAPFPIPKDVLEELSCELIGDGYDAMINAMLAGSRVNVLQREISPTIH